MAERGHPRGVREADNLTATPTAGVHLATFAKILVYGPILGRICSVNYMQREETKNKQTKHRKIQKRTIEFGRRWKKNGRFGDLSHTRVG